GDRLPQLPHRQPRLEGRAYLWSEDLLHPPGPLRPRHRSRGVHPVGDPGHPGEGALRDDLVLRRGRLPGPATVGALHRQRLSRGDPLRGRRISLLPQGAVPEPPLAAELLPRGSPERRAAEEDGQDRTRRRLRHHRGGLLDVRRLPAPGPHHLEKFTQEGIYPSQQYAVTQLGQPTTRAYRGPRTTEETFIDLAKAMGLPGVGKDAFGPGTSFDASEDYWLKLAANVAYDGEEPVPDASAEEEEIFAGAREKALGDTFDLARWQESVTGEEWKKVVTVLNRGGRF